MQSLFSPSKVSWPSDAFAWSLLTFLCNRQDRCFAQRVRIPGPIGPSLKTYRVRDCLRNLTCLWLQGPSHTGHSYVPLFCNFYSFVLLKEKQAACSQGWASLSRFGAFCPLFIGKNNSSIIEIKVNPFSFSSASLKGSRTQLNLDNMQMRRQGILSPEDTSAWWSPGKYTHPAKSSLQALAIRKLIYPLVRLIIRVLCD